MRVGVVYNLKRGGTGLPFEAEYDSPETIATICAALAARGDTPVPLEADLELWPRLRHERFDLVFNLAEGLRGECREAQVPALLEMLGVPYTASRVLALAVCLDKPACKRLLLASGVPTPRFDVVPVGVAAPTEGLRWPLFVKPAGEGSSVGISEASLCQSVAEVATQVRHVHERFGEAALVEEFLPGREFTVGILGNDPLRVLPLTEINYAALPLGSPHVYSYRFKQDLGDDRYYFCPAKLDAALEAAVSAVAVGAFRVTGCADVARVDVRLDADGRPLVLEVNPLPGLAPGWSDLPRQASVAGLSYTDLIDAIVQAAVERWKLPASAPTCQ